MREAGPEIPKVDEIVGEEVQEHGRYGRLIAVAVVLTTLLAAVRWQNIAKQTESDTSAIASSQHIPFICSPTLQKNCSPTEASYSPEQDPQFPNRYMQRSQWPAY